jgi:hypothetical protein
VILKAMMLGQSLTNIIVGLVQVTGQAQVTLVFVVVGASLSAH